MEARRRGRKLEVIEGEEKEGEKGEGREVSDEMGARSSMDARDAKLAMKGLSETRTYRFPQLNSSSTLFSDNRKERGVKMRLNRRRRGNRELQNLQRTESARELHYSES
jgi:hypothetical protein